MRGGRLGAETGACAASSVGAPQASQNLCSAGLGVEQDAQTISKFRPCPQLPQNLALGWFS